MMRERFQWLRYRYAVLSIVVAGSVLAMGALYPRAASAQLSPRPSRIYTSGPFHLQDSERVMLSVVQPPVLRIRESPTLVVMSSSGKRIFSHPVPVSPDLALASFFDITYRTGVAGADPKQGFFDISYGIRESPTRRSLGIVESPDGVLIAMLLPAVQLDGRTRPPLAASMQSFDMNGATTSYSFFDVFTE